ncbi:hypothetical protein EOA22_34015, partial [Mesorhizobium sp. M7A.F.Ca.US.014.04.1.1]
MTTFVSMLFRRRVQDGPLRPNGAKAAFWAAQMDDQGLQEEKMAEIEFRAVSKGGLKVTTIGLGGTGLGNMYRAVDTDAAVKTVQAAYENGIRYFDTAPVYGFGVSETRLGLAIKSLPRADIVISSKIGYDLVPIPP